MRLILFPFLMILVLSDTCTSGQPCKNKLVYQIGTQNLTDPFTLYLADPELFLILSAPTIAINYPVAQVANIPYNYVVSGKSSACSKTQVCCSNITYSPSNDTVSVYSVGSPTINQTVSFFDQKVSNKLSILSKSFSSSKYKIDIEVPQLNDDFSNSYLISKDVNITKEMQQLPILIPQSFYKKTYQCQFIGKMDSSICSKSCNYFMSSQSLFQSKLYELPTDFSYEKGNLVYMGLQNYKIKVTLYDPKSAPTVNPLNGTLIKLIRQSITYSSPNYCLNLSLLNPANISSLANILIDTTQSNVYRKMLLFQQYQSLNLSICTTYRQYNLKLNGVDYSYSYQQTTNQEQQNQTTYKNVQKQCKGICHWWIWLIIGLAITSVIIISLLIVRAVCISRRKTAAKLEAKLQSIAGMSLPTNTSLPTLTTLCDMTIQHYPPTVLNRSFSNSLSGSRRVLQSPRIR